MERRTLRYERSYVTSKLKIVKQRKTRTKYAYWHPKNFWAVFKENGLFTNWRNTQVFGRSKTTSIWQAFLKNVWKLVAAAWCNVKTALESQMAQLTNTPVSCKVVFGDENWLQNTINNVAAQSIFSCLCKEVLNQTGKLLQLTYCYTSHFQSDSSILCQGSAVMIAGRTTTVHQVKLNQVHNVSV